MAAFSSSVYEVNEIDYTTCDILTQALRALLESVAISCGSIARAELALFRLF